MAMKLQAVDKTFLCQKPVGRPCLEALGRLRLDRDGLKLAIYHCEYHPTLPLTIIRPRLIRVGDCTTPLM